MREIETERLILRHLREGDEDAIFNNWARDPEVTRYLTWNPHTDVSETRAVLSRWLNEYSDPRTYRWGIENRETGVLMGMIDVVGYHHGNPVIGYCLGHAFWSNGYMTEACRAVIAELKKDGYGTIVIEAADENIGSNRVIEKCGFELVGTWEEKYSDFRDEMLPINSYRLFPEKRRSGDYNDINSETIDRWVDEDWEWGRPISHEDFLRAKNGDWSVLLTPTRPVPREWFPDLRGRRILGLASGGAQQMPVFAALGAECWVLDFSERQIESEKRVARREGYRIRAIRADMTKPLPFSDGFFDLIFHPVSNCYVRDVEAIWRECARVLKTGGALLSGLDNGVNYLFDEDESRVVNFLPFDPLVNPGQMESLERNDCGVQFSHSIAEQIGGQLRAGFRLLDIYDDTNGAGFLHEHGVPTFWATRAVKE